MANVMLPKYVPCTKQSPGSSIDWGNPLTKDLVYLGFGDPSGINFVNNSSSVDVNGQTPIPSPIGIGFNNDGSARYRTYPITPFSVPDSQVSIGAVFIPYSIYEEVICSVYQSGTSSRCQIQISGSGQWQVFTASGQLQASVIAVAGVPTNLSATFGMNETNGTKIFLNGSKILQGTLAATSGVYNSVTIGARRGLSGFGLYFNGVISLQAVWKRALTDAEHASFTSNPWQLLHQRVQSPQNVTTKENRKPIIRESNMMGTSKRKLSDVNLLPNNKILAKDRNRQPQGSVEIDWGNSITRGLHALWSGATPQIEILSNRLRVGGDNSQLISYGINREGGFQSTQVSSSSVSTEFRLNRPTNTASPFTIVCRFRIKTIPVGDRTVIYFGNYSGETAEIVLRSTGRISGTTIRANTTVNSDNIYSSGDWITAVYTGSEGSFKLWVNGVLQSTTNTGSLGSFQGRDILSIRASDSEVVVAQAYTRALSDAEVMSISNNPWQIFRQSSNLPLLK